MLKEKKWRKRFVLSFCCTIFSMGFYPTEISEGKSDFLIQDGILTAYTGSDVVVTIPDGVTTIGKNVFENSKIQEAVLPASVKKIEDWAFSGCKELKSVVLPEGVSDIGDVAFYECEKLQDILLPDSLKTIGYIAFGCSGLTDITIPSSVTEIENAAFEECKKLKSVQLPEQLKVISQDVFNRCYSLEKINIPESVEKIGSEAFAHCYNMKEVVIYSNKIKEIGKRPFLFHAVDRKILFKKKVSKAYKQKFNDSNYIRKGAVLYHNTSSLTLSPTVDMCAVKYTKKGKLTVPKKVGKYTVTGVKNINDTRGPCVIGSEHTGITEVELADTITELGDTVFSHAPFKKVKLPANLTSIGERAFSNNCLIEINLPKKIEFIGKEAFARYYSVSEKYALPDEDLSDLPKSIVIPESVDHISAGNFGYYCASYPTDEDIELYYAKIKGYKVKGKKGSYAQKYAKKHKLKFVPIN